MPDVGATLHGGSAQVDANLALVNGLQWLEGTAFGVIKMKIHAFSLPSLRAWGITFSTRGVKLAP